MEAFELSMALGQVNRAESRSSTMLDPILSQPSTSSTHISQFSAQLDNDSMVETLQDSQKAENTVTKAKRSKKRQRCAEEEIMLRDFGPERQSGRLRILKEYPPEPPTLVQPVASPKNTPRKKASERNVKKKGEKLSKSEKKGQRKKEVELRAIEEKTTMTKKALKKAKRKNKRDKSQDEVEVINAKGGSKAVREDRKSSDPSKSRSSTKRKERKRRRKEVQSATVPAPVLIVDAPSPEIGDEIVAIRASSSHFTGRSGHNIGEETVAMHAGSHASLESMFHEAPFEPTAHIAGDIIVNKRRGAKLNPNHAGTESKRQIGSRLLEYSQMSVSKRPGIKSSTFARVMRLVADLPPVQVADKPLKRQHAAHRPPVWAESRQELCEALPYYRAFQSGLYMNQKVAFGYLLDGFPAPRDVCAHNARVIISHGGGQCIRPIADTGQKLPPVLAGDQLISEARVATLVRAWKHKTPLVLLAGSGYALLPFKLDCSYVVLGWYWVSHVWTEAEPVAEGVKPPVGRDWYKRVKVRFDWVDSQGQPWWELAGGMPATAVTVATEIAPSPEAKRIAVTELVDRSQGSAGSEELQRTDTAISFSSSLDFETTAQRSLRPTSATRKCKGKERELGSVDPLSGLLTPPITPTSIDGCQIATGEIDSAHYDEAHIPLIGDETTSDSRPMRRRLPGDYVLASFGDTITMSTDADARSFTYESCRYCKKPSPRMYREGWLCLTTECTAYWMLSSPIGLLPIPPGFGLSYNPTFLHPLPTPAGIKIPYDIAPPRPKLGIPDETGVGSADSAGSRSLWRGWVCENCGRANCRFRWEVWQCLSCHQLLAPIDPYSGLVSVKSVAPLIPALLGDPVVDSGSGIMVEMRRVQAPAATVMIYHLPESIGTVYHFINDDNDFADAIFDRYQREAASTRVPLFQRRPLNAHQIRGQLLAQHFAVNSGASYKYNVDSLSLSFDESPSSVIQALDAITERVEKVVGHKVEFNEVLSVLYREGQKMSWHDDGEPGLGPIVAGLSLGSDAVISWRRKSAHTQSNATYLKGMPDPRKTPTPPIALSLVTSHGDIVIMEGRDMQKKYVHKVIPSGFRVAATARVIGK